MANIVDVAKRAGVAISTVSNIINGTRYVSPEITQKVLQVIEELGYETDPIARRMKGARSDMIGIIITNFSRVFFAPVLSQCREIASAHGFTLMCVESNDDFELEKQYVNIMKKNSFDAIILDTVAELDNYKYYEELRTLSSKGKRVSVVCLERDCSEYGLNSVEPDNYKGAVVATEHLLNLGCENILHVTGPINSLSAEKRVRGYTDTINSRQNMTPQIAFGEFSLKSGYDIVKKTLVQNRVIPFDAIFASNDQMAVGAMQALKEFRIRVPEDVRVVGFDDSFVASLVDPSLTSIHISRSVIAFETMKMVLDCLEDVASPARHFSVEANLMVRKSTDPNVYIPSGFAADW